MVKKVVNEKLLNPTWLLNAFGSIPLSILIMLLCELRIMPFLLFRLALKNDLIVTKPLIDVFKNN